GSGTWSVLQGTANVLVASSPSTAISGLSPGNNLFEWTISNGVCPVSAATVSVWRDIPPSVSDAGPDQQVCGSDATLSAVMPATGVGSWSVVSGGATINNITFPVSSVSSLSVSINKFIWVVSSGVCPSSVDTVLIERF